MEWLKLRPAEGKDENGLVYLWLKSYAQSRYGRAIGANVSGSNEERAYWRDEQPRVMWHLAHDDVRIACDSQDEDIIYGMACMTESHTLHSFVVKYRFIKEGFGLEFIPLLLGDAVNEPLGYTTELPDLERVLRFSGMTGKSGAPLRMPPSWYFDGSFYFRNKERA